MTSLLKKILKIFFGGKKLTVLMVRAIGNSVHIAIPAIQVAAVNLSKKNRVALIRRNSEPFRRNAGRLSFEIIKFSFLRFGIYFCSEYIFKKSFFSKIFLLPGSGKNRQQHLFIF